MGAAEVSSKFALSSNNLSFNVVLAPSISDSLYLSLQ